MNIHIHNLFMDIYHSVMDILDLKYKLFDGNHVYPSLNYDCL